MIAFLVATLSLVAISTIAGLVREHESEHGSQWSAIQ
ncbi:hypothetical protein ABIE45_006210 [Methylobacterium sp. OAE515]